MTRKRKDEGYIQQKVSLPAVLMARFSRLHWDPVLIKTRYGAISDVLTALLTNYVNKLEQGQPEPLYRKLPDGSFEKLLEGTEIDA